jgi:hypothetical protein
VSQPEFEPVAVSLSLPGRPWRSPRCRGSQVVFSVPGGQREDNVKRRVEERSYAQQLVPWMTLRNYHELTRPHSDVRGLRDAK